MSSSVVTGIEYLFSQVHGLRGKGVHGDRLAGLAGAATEENFFRQLQWPELAPECPFAKIAVERQLRQLADLMQRLSGGWAAFYRIVIENRAVDNFRLVLGARFMNEHDDDDVRDMFITIPGIPNDYFRKMLECKDADELVRFLSPGSVYAEVGDILGSLAEDGNIMRAECRLDKLQFKRMLNAARALPLSVRSVIVNAVRMEIDISNILIVLRNVETYHLPKDELLEYLMDGGRDISPDVMSAMTECANPASVVALLPADWKNLAAPGGIPLPVAKIENAFWKRLLHYANRGFYDFSNPYTGVLLYTYLLRFETINLCRVYEGIRFGLPARVIRELLIDDSSTQVR